MLLEVIENTCETFFVTDPDGAILYVNPAFETLTGYKRGDVLGKKPSFLKSGEHGEDFYRGMWGTIKSGRRWNGRIVNRRADGSAYTEEVRICPIPGPDGKPKYFLALRHDIAREVQLEQQLNQSQKMESLGLLAGQISHDFNNLLTVIIGSMELITEDLKPGSVSAKLSTEILRSSKEAAGMIKQLMVFARRQDSRPVVCSLNDPLREMKVLFDGLLGRNVSVLYSLDDALRPVKIEPEHFKQAVMNLAVNAKDAMGGSGAISIKTCNSDPAALPPDLPPGDYSVFEITDTGPGIPPEVLPRIFEPFFTTKPKGKGTGLGLSTVYGIVSQDRGRIYASNKQGSGAVFTVYFPSAVSA